MAVNAFARTVWCRTRFVAFHYWPGASEKGYTYLESPHRHEFHVHAGVRVSHNERDVEFQRLRFELDTWLQAVYTYKYSTSQTAMTKSCETIAEEIAIYLDSLGYKPVVVDVSEDGENGAEVLFDAE